MVAISNDQRARVFGTVAEMYDRWRPAYPDAAVDWLVPESARRVIDLGAGTGKLTNMLLNRGLAVVAVEPDAEMMTVLERNYPAAETFISSAEQLPVPDASVDAVLVAQAWHWFDPDRALSEARRVVRAGGWLGLLWNAESPCLDWQYKLAALNPDDQDASEESDFVPPELSMLPHDTLEVRWAETLAASALRARLSTHSAYAVMPERERSAKLDVVEQLAREEMSRTGEPVVQLDHVAACIRIAL